MTREEAIRRYNETHTGGVQKSTPSISALSREEAIARYDAKQASKSWETRIGSIASREWQPPEYESYIPEEYKGKYEDFEEGWYGFDTVAAELKHNYGITPDKLENMTDEEKKLVTYLYTQDEPSLFEKIFAVKSDDKAYVRYAKELEEELERRGIERAAYEAQRNDGFWDKVGTSIGSVGNRVLGTFEGVDAIADALSGREVDETPFYTTLAEVKRQGVSEDMSGVGKFLYDVGMSWGDSMAMTGIGMLTGNPRAAKAISLIGMGSQAMSSTIADSKRRGMSDLQAIGNGILAGGIEAATEMIGIDALFDTRAFRNAFGKYLLKNVGANAGEEALAEVLGTVSDALVGQDKSRFMAKVREYQAEGYNESGAAAMAVLSVLGDTALAGLSGALMGLGSGTVGGAAQNVALNTRDVREGRAIRGLANAGKDLYGAARTMDNDKRIAAALKKLGEASSDSRSEAKLTGRLDRLAAEEYGRRSLEEYMTPEEINEQIKQGGADALKYYESRDDYKRAYTNYARKIDTAKRTAINAEASAAALMVAPAEYGKRYEGELREVFDKGLAQYGGKKYKYPLWFEIAVSMGRQSGSRGLEEMLKTLPTEDRRGVLTLDNATIAAAFNEGRRIAAEYAEEQNEADERKKAGEMAEESRRKATAAEIAKKSSEGEKNSSEAEDITSGIRDNVLISDEVKNAKLTNSQQSQLKKLKRLGRYLDGYTFVVQFGHEGGKLGSQNAFFDPTNRTIYVNIEAGRQYRMTGDGSVELYEAALEAAWTHEIGHAIRIDAPTRYAELRDFIRTRLYREGGFENAVEKRRAQYEGALGREIGYEYAEEEVICNSLGALMTSERLLNELAGNHRSLFSRLWRAVTEFFKNVMRRMRGMDGDFTAKTEEQRIVERALLKERRRLEDMFVGAMREANEVSRATLALNDQNKTTSDNKVAKSAENENVRTTDESNTPEMAEKKPLTDTNSENVQVTDENNDIIRFSLMEDIPLSESVDKVMKMSDTEAIRNKEEGNFVSIAKITPTVILDNVKDAENLQIVMRFDSFYLATRRNGALAGHYHNYGEIMKQLPDIMEDPLAIVRMNDNRLNLLAAVHTEKGENSIISVELNTVKDINDKNEKYNLIVSVIPSGANYMRNNLMKRGIKVEYEKEDLPQVNHQLHEWLATVNERSSTVIIPDSAKKSNPSEEKSAKKILNGKYSISDEHYLSAVKRGDMETAQAMVDEAAKFEMKNTKIKMADGSLRKVYHGTNTGEFTVFNPDYIGMSSGDHGFFGEGFYFAYSKSEAAYYGAKRIVTAFLNIQNPFDFQAELQTFQGKRAVYGRAPDAIAFLNFAEKFPQIAVKATVSVVDETGARDISLIDFAKAFRDVIENKKFEYQISKDEYGDKETIVLADKVAYEYNYNGEQHTYYDYKFEKHFYGEANELDVAYEYLASVVFKAIDMYSRTRLILDYNREFTSALKKMGYDGAVQSVDGDEAVAFYPEQIKSADPVTYDDNGEVIPLSERFKTDNEDIRYSLRDRLEREELADRFDRIAETDAEREIVEKYKAEIEIADDAIDERRRVIKRLDEIEGKAGFGDERKRLNRELEHWNSVITGHDSRLFELEGFKPFRDMVERYEQALRERHARGGSDRFDESHMWISQAKYRELINRSRGEKFYTQKDAQVIEDKIYDMDKLSRRKKNQLVEALWEGMNAAKTEADVEGVIKSVGDLIFNEITRELTVENPEIADNAETLEYLGGYVQRLSFSEDMKEEIRHKYDEDGTRSFMGRWQNKHSDGRVVAADVFVTEFARENAGYEYLEDMPAADALFEIDAIYDRMKNTEKRVGAYDDMTAEELSDVRRSIEQTLREAFRDGGEMPLVAKKSVSTEAMITLLKNQRDDAEAKVSEVMSIQRAKLMLSREANSIRDMKRGTFDNANEVRGTRVMELLRELGKFEYRGTFSEKDVREKVRGLYAWYTSPEADAVLGARGKDNDAASTNLRSAYIEEMLKEISLGEGRLTANELYGLAKILAAFRNIAKNYNKVWRAGKWVDALQVAEKYIGVLKLSKELKGGDWFGKAAFRAYFDEFADPLSIVRRYDGYLEGGYFTDTFNMFREAAVNLEVTYSDVTKDYFEFFKKHKNYERDIQTRSVSIYGVDVPMKAAMSIYMMIRQDHALRGFVGQGVSFVGFNGEVQTARPLSVEAAIRFKIDAMARMAMEDYGLDEKAARANAESAVKDATWDAGNATISELRAAAEPTKAAIEAAMTGEDRELIAIIGRDMNGPLRELKRTTDLERLGFTNVMEGSSYFPIKRSGIAEKVETLAYRDELDSVSNISANKSREKGARQALFADDILKVYTRHARAICTYATMQQSIDFYDRIYNTSLTGDPNDNVKVGAVASEVWGKKQSGAKVENNGHAAFFRELIQDIQKLRSSRDNFLNNLLGGLRGGAAVAGIGLNGKVLMSQWFSFAAAAHELDIGSLIKGGVMWVGKTRIDFMTPSGWKRLRELGAIVDEYCPLARIRNEDNYAYLAQGVIEKGEGANVKRRAKGALGDGIKKLQEWSMWGIGRMDRAVICSLFEACKAEAVTADAPLGSEDNLVEAGRRLTEIILNTQQNALATEKSRAMRSEQEIIKAMTMFSSDAMKSNSRMLDAIGEARALRKRLTMDGLTDAARRRLRARQKTVGKRVAKSVGVVMMNSVYMAALTLLFRWWRGKLEEDEEIFQSVALDVLTGMFGGLPLIRDIVDKLINGYDVTDSSLDVLTDFLGTVKTLTETVTKVITGDTEWGDVVRSLRKLVFAYSQIVGLPVRNVWNGICGVIDKFNPELAKMLNG